MSYIVLVGHSPTMHACMHHKRSLPIFCWLTTDAYLQPLSHAIQAEGNGRYDGLIQFKFKLSELFEVLDPAEDNGRYDGLIQFQFKLSKLFELLGTAVNP